MTQDVKTLLAQDFFKRIIDIMVDEAKGLGNDYLITIAGVLSSSLNIRSEEKFVELMNDENNKQEYEAGQAHITKFFEDNAGALSEALHFEEALPIFE